MAPDGSPDVRDQSVIHVSGAEFARIASLKRRLYGDRKAKRAEKRAFLPWGMRKREEPKAARPVHKRTTASLRQRLIARLDALWSTIVLMRHRKIFGAMCLICTTRPATLAYHIVPKQRGHSIRWDLEDGVGGCSFCNGAEVMNRSLYRDIHVARFGKEFVEKLEARARLRVKLDMADLRSKIESFLQIIANRPWEK